MTDEPIRLHEYHLVDADGYDELVVGPEDTPLVKALRKMEGEVLALLETVQTAIAQAEEFRS